MNVFAHSLNTNTDFSLYRFGGGFELMDAGGDKDGIWTIMESGLQ